MTITRPLPATGGSRPDRAAGASAWLLACAALFACGWGGNQFTPLLTLYRSADGWTATTVDALLGAYVVGLAPALIMGGRLSDRLGRRPVVLMALVSSIAGSALLATGRLGDLAAGRLLSGSGVGLAMAVGTGWATELTVAGGGSAASGARRASLSLTAGFGLGAGVAGALAQWGPAPEALPYLVHVGLAVAVLIALAVRPVGVAAARTATPVVAGRLLSDAERRRRLRRLVVPMAPWVFGALGVAYAILPQAMAHRIGHFALLYATGLTVVTLGCGILVQPLARRLDHPSAPLAMRAAMLLTVAGIGLAAAAVALTNPVVAALAAAVLGCSYGIGLIAGLLEVQRIAAPDELVSLTGGYYALAYVGFLFPAALAYAGRWVATGPELALLAAVAAGCAVVIARHRPATAAPA